MKSSTGDLSAFDLNPFNAPIWQGSGLPVGSIDFDPTHSYAFREYELPTLELAATALATYFTAGLATPLFTGAWAGAAGLGVGTLVGTGGAMGLEALNKQWEGSNVQTGWYAATAPYIGVALGDLAAAWSPLGPTGTAVVGAGEARPLYNSYVNYVPPAMPLAESAPSSEYTTIPDSGSDSLATIGATQPPSGSADSLKTTSQVIGILEQAQKLYSKPAASAAAASAPAPKLPAGATTPVMQGVVGFALIFAAAKLLKEI